MIQIMKFYSISVYLFAHEYVITTYISILLWEKLVKIFTKPYVTENRLSHIEILYKYQWNDCIVNYLLYYVKQHTHYIFPKNYQQRCIIHTYISLQCEIRLLLIRFLYVVYVSGAKCYNIVYCNMFSSDKNVLNHFLVWNLSNLISGIVISWFQTT